VTDLLNKNQQMTCAAELSIMHRHGGRRTSNASPLALHSQIRRARAGRARIVDSVVPRSTDYVATATDEGILQLPLKQQLSESDLVNVFGYDRDLQGKYALPLPGSLHRSCTGGASF
jgi:hypothetical protein